MIMQMHSGNLRLVLSVFENIPGLTLEKFANGVEGGQADSFHLAGLDEGEVLLRDAHKLRQVLGFDLVSGRHDVKVDDDGHENP